LDNDKTSLICPEGYLTLQALFEITLGAYTSSQYAQPYSRIQDYELKEMITTEINGGCKPSAGVIR
jgi:hypothetical protein